MRKVMIATPFKGLESWSPYTESIARTLIELHRLTKIPVEFACEHGNAYVDRARDSLARHFMQSDCSDLFFIDSDIVWDFPSFLRVFLADEEIVAGNFPMKNNWSQFAFGAIKTKGQYRLSSKKLFPAKFAATGFMKIRKSVFKRIVVANPDDYFVEHKLRYHRFFSRISEGRGDLGEDFSFCERARAVGAKIWIEPNCNLGHIGAVQHYGNYLLHLDQQVKEEEKVAKRKGSKKGGCR